MEQETKQAAQRPAETQPQAEMTSAQPNPSQSAIPDIPGWVLGVVTVLAGNAWIQSQL